MTATTRQDRASQLAADPGRWIPCTTRSGQTCFAIESQRTPGVYHLCTAEQCSCPAGQWSSEPCKHRTAVRIVLVARGLLPRYEASESRWERQEHDDGNVVYLPRRAAVVANAKRYSEIFDRFSGD